MAKVLTRGLSSVPAMKSGIDESEGEVQVRGGI